MNTLELRRSTETHKKHEVALGRSRVVDIQSVFYDFIVDGESFADSVLGKDWLKGSGDLTFLSDRACPKWRWEKYQECIAVAAGEFAGGRTGLYYCMCFEPGDGVLAIGISSDDAVIHWSDCGWVGDADDSPFEAEEAFKPLSFDREQYIKVVGTAVFDLEYDGLRQILNTIDFLGVEPNEDDHTLDEYDCILSDILAILHDGGEVSELERYLDKELFGHFGISSTARNRKKWAKKIYQWWVHWPGVL